MTPPDPPLQFTPDDPGPAGPHPTGARLASGPPPPYGGFGDGAPGTSGQGYWVPVQTFEPPRPGGSEEEGDRLVSVLEFLHRHRWVIALTTALVAAAAALYAYTREPVYTASSVVLVDLDPVDSRSAVDDGPGGPEEAFATNERPLAAELFLLQTSTTIWERVAERLAAAHPAAAGFQGVEVDFGVVDPVANALGVYASSEDPERAAVVANAFAEEYVALTREATRDRISGLLETLEDREADRREELRRLEAEQQALGYQSGAAAPSAQESAVLATQISSIEMQREQARRDLQTRRATLQATLDDLGRIEPQLAEQISSGDTERLEALRAEIAELRTDRELTERRYPDPATRDARVVARLNQIDAQIQRRADEAGQLSQRIAAAGVSGAGAPGSANLAYASELRRTAQGERVAISALENQVDRLDALLARRYAELNRLPAQSAAQARRQVEQAQVEQARAYAEQTYETETERLRQVQAQAAGRSGYARVVQAAAVPVSPSGLASPYIVFLGLFVGLSLGLALAAVREKVDGRFYKPEQLAGLGHPVLTTVPDMDPLLDEHARRDADGERPSAGLASLLSPLSPMAETYRHLRTTVRRLGAGRPPEVILVTSPGAGDGKSTTAINFAVALAEGGLQTVLVDADLRRPSLHKVFGVARSPGLLERLTGGGPEASDVAVEVGVDNLWLVPAGGAAPGEGEGGGAGPGAALSSPAVGAYFQELRSRYDVVVVDTPPVLAAADAGRLSEESDAVLLMVRAGQTREGEVAHALDALRLVGAPVAGLVFNGFDASQTYSYKHKYRAYTQMGLYPDYKETVPDPSSWRSPLRRRPKDRPTPTQP